LVPSKRYTLLSLPIAFLLWYLTFQVSVFDFWFRIGTSTSVLLIIALLLRRKEVAPKLMVTGAVVGAVSGLLLYAFFYAGFQFLKGNPAFLGQVSSVYLYRSSQPEYLIFLLLVFPVGPAEELYWRGLIQSDLQSRWGETRGFVTASTLYALIHLPTLNPSLIFVALTGGLVWGYLYKRYGNIFPCIVSHILFDELIFVVVPIG